MKNLLLCLFSLTLLCLVPLFAAVPARAARADEVNGEVNVAANGAVNGVLAQERIVKLPDDSGKWFISVVGERNDARYTKVLGWFASDANLKKLKDQVHFCPVDTEMTIYRTRYSYFVKELPTVRLQKPDGTVVYEATGDKIPMTAAGLHGAVANAVTKAEGLRPVLPWRADLRRRCPLKPSPTPQPNPDPDPTPTPDPDPQPIDGPDGPPVIDEPVEPVEAVVQWVWLPLLCFMGLLAGVACGYGKQLYQKLHPPVK